MKTILRWIAVLPAAITSYLLAYALYKAFGYLSAWLGPSDDYDWVTTYTLPAIASGAATYYYITAGVYTAPKYKKQTAIVLAVILSMVLICATWAIIKLSHWKSFVEVIGGLAGLIYTLGEVIKEDRLYQVELQSQVDSKRKKQLLQSLKDRGLLLKDDNSN